MSTPRLEAAAVRLPNANVLLAAGGYSSGTTFATVESYNPSTDTWSALPPMTSARWGHTITLLDNGNVLVAGTCSAGNQKSAELYNPTTNTWTSIPQMSWNHCRHVATKLTNGKVLLTGSASSQLDGSTAEVYDVVTNTWSTVPSMSLPRYYHTATLLPNGRVLVAGGNSSGSPTSTAELYEYQTCSVNNDCASGYCVDGVCCNSACTGTCVACSAGKKGSGPDGTCGSIGSGLDPDNECTVQGAPGCATGGACNGSGACQVYPPSGTVCLAASCVGAILQKADTCNGVGSCVDQGVQDCSPFACSGGACLSTCSSDAQCAPAAYCNAPSCTPKKVTGQLCGAPNQCQSGLCIDGVCCGTTCSGTCFACSTAKKGLGPDGACGPIQAGLDPDNECSAQNASTCGTNGVCDGAGACQKHPSGTTCVPASCSGTVLFKTDQCNGSGTCMDGGSQQCSPFACLGGACLTTCSLDAQCASSAYCSGMTCLSKMLVGQACIASNQCQTGHCVDGVCCDTVCAGSCSACSASKKGSGADGECGVVAADTDPDEECLNEGEPTCGFNGVCDGGGACQKFVAGTVCADPWCAGTFLNTLDTCDGGGACADGGIVDCAPFACAMGGCLTDCTNDAECAPAAYCDGAVCLPEKATGEPCAGANQCQSGFCVDGVCCEGACASTCMACSAAKKGGGDDGACGPIAAGVDPDGECDNQGESSCGTDGSCDGEGACALYADATVCSAAECVGSVFHAVDMCDGTGTCLDGGAEDCAPFACSPEGCLTACSSDAGCDATAFCEDATCVLKLAVGAPCDADAQCQTSFCVDAVCCASACDGECSACSAAKKGGGPDGGCAPIAAGTDPDNECLDQGAASCGTNGDCNGHGACQKYTEGCEGDGGGTGSGGGGDPSTADDVKSFYACAAIPGAPSRGGAAALAVSLLMAIARRRRSRLTPA